MTHHYNLRNSAKNITTNMEQEQQIVNPPPASSVQPSSENNAAPGPDSGPAMDMTSLQRQIAEMQQALNHVAARPPVQTASVEFNVGSGLLQPGQFQGLPDEDPLGWLDRFDAWVDLTNVDNRQLPHAMRLLLRRSAVSRFSALPTEDRENKERLYAAFRNRFGRQPSWLMEQQLWSRTMLDHEDIEVYINEIDQRCHRLGMDGKTQVSAFVRGLTPHLRAYVIQQNPSTFDEAAQAARLAQEAKLITTSSQNQPTQDSLLINMVKTVTELSETVRSLKQHHQPQVTMATADKGKSKFSHSEAVNCQLCGRRGHTALSCRLNEKSSGQNVRCFNCHRFGHKAYQCHLNN